MLEKKSVQHSVRDLTNTLLKYTECEPNLDNLYKLPFFYTELKWNYLYFFLILTI